MVFSPPTNPQQIITPTSLNRMVRTLLQSEIGLVWLSAEISNFVAASSGHWYFTLKDNKAQIRAAMFKQANRFIKPLPKDGDKVLVRASVSLYEPRGDYQLIVEHLEAEGEGKLKLEFEKLKLKLNQEGLFATERKRPLPTSINRIGIVTSSSGAALHDVLTVLKRRSPLTEVIIYPSLVQGEQAASSLKNALLMANKRQEVDVILLTRGGGSIEDLWCFNDEVLARTIVDSAIPVISAVGHEIDTTISDYVADMRAPTPSAAAELLSQDKQELADKINRLSQRLSQQIHSVVQQSKQRQTALLRHLSLLHPNRQLQQYSQQLDQIQNRLHMLMGARLTKEKTQVANLSNRFANLKLDTWLTKKRDYCDSITARLVKSWQHQLTSKRLKLQSNAAQLNAVSPLATMSRGYSISFQDDQIIHSVDQVSMNHPLVTRMYDGEVLSQPIERKIIKKTQKT